MTGDTRMMCPIPHLGYCIYERCNFWDEQKQECSGLCFGEYDPLRETSASHPDSPCTIYWTEDSD
uniref:Uncharacterized protein n=1 Tax=Desulfobacca acetoxidans TaxID=60893 RepID=A0A7V4G8I1_9BACT